MDHVTAVEEAIVDDLLVKAINKGYTVSVNDGEEWVLARSSAIPHIKAAMASTDHDILGLRTLDGDRVGNIVLIWGNGCDLISEHTDNAAINALVNEVNTGAN